ncbi:MAG: nitroreductase family deazaflavin-dependent oxidoreductase [Pseudonocardiales bacterium]|nr:nitroreductase family deazaflavin-dependent oxidoreductase [Pseudonocardiales bacterium]MBV9652429.1 nitroreductase family deazaflavin-dependent oxidoreductase [Pseudonocardiales bacterium]
MDSGPARGRTGQHPEMPPSADLNSARTDCLTGMTVARGMLVVNAREVEGAERVERWERAVRTFPPYAEYQKKTDRQIPAFALNPK